MANPTKALHDLLRTRALARPTSADKEARERGHAGLAQRLAASTILHPNEVSGEYDAGRMLTTTLGSGVQRPITLEDLRAFQQNVRLLKGKQKYKGGITAQAVIDFSLASDRARANADIRTSVPISVKADTFHFITNSSPGSNVSRHHVHVQFLDFESAVAASSLDHKKIGKQVASGRLKINCDCGRFRFWYRYIASVGQYVWGPIESGYPKIRNPKLVGVACKHLLRTMQVLLKDTIVQRKIAEQVIKARDVLDKKAVRAQRTKAADLRAHADQQAAKRSDARKLKTTDDKAAESARRKARTSMAKKAVEKATKGPTPGQMAKTRNKAAAGLQAALSLGAISKEQFDTAMANLGKVK